MNRTSLHTWLFFLLPLLYFMTLPVSMGDLGVWIKLGLDSINAGSLVTNDSYSVLDTKEMVYPAAMPSVYGHLHRLGQLEAVLYFHRIVLLIFLFLVYRSSIKTSQGQALSTRSLFYVLLFFFGISILFIDRPALLAIIPFIISFKILSQREKLSAKNIAFLVLLETIWVNVHGSWAIMLGMVIWRAALRGIVERRFQFRDWVGCILVGVATMLNPFGVKVWSYLAETDQVSRHRNITEWAPTLYPNEFFSQTVAYCLLVFLISVHAYTRRRTTQWSSPFYPLLVLGFLAIRHTVWPFLSMLIFLKNENLLATVLAGRESRKRINVAIVILLVSAAILVTPTFKPKFVEYLPSNKNKLFTNIAPVSFAEIIKSENDPRPIFNQFEIGSYLIYALPNKIYADTRNIIYSEEDITAYHAITRGEFGWENVLARHGIGWIVIDRNYSSGLRAKLTENGRWIKKATDDSVELYQLRVK